MKRFVAALLCASMTTGCYTMSVDLRDPSIQPGSKDRRQRVVRTIEHETKGWFMINGLVPISTLDITPIREQLRDDERIAGAQVTTQVNATDMLVALGGGVVGGIIGALMSANNPSAAAMGSVVVTLVTWLIPTSHTMRVVADVEKDTH